MAMLRIVMLATGGGECHAECSQCGSGVDYEEAMDLAGESVCAECYDESMAECCVCREKFPDADSGLVVMMTEDGHGIPKGVYLVRRWPFFSQPLVGSGYTHDDALLRAADLPAKVAECTEWWTPGQDVCIACAAPYESKRTEPIGKFYTDLSALHDRAIALWQEQLRIEESRTRDRVDGEIEV